jgi:NTE family protein
LGHLDKRLQKLLKEAAAPSVEYIDYDIAPVKSIIAIQGGGSWSIAAAEALKVLTPHLLKAGTIEAVSGTSGGAANAALMVKGLNEDRGAEGVTHYLDRFWNKIKQAGGMMKVPRMFSSSPLLAEEDRWPNIPRSYISLTEAFRHINPFIQMSMPTSSIKGIIDNVIGNWTPVQTGKTAIYTNSIQQNIFTRKETYQVKTGTSVDGDAISESAGLDELGGHLRMNELMSPLNWAQGDINRYRDGAYKLNPDMETMIANHDATDVIVIALHGADGESKSPREQKLYTDQIHRDLTSMQLDDGRRVNFHVIQIKLPGNATSRINTDPEYLELLQELGRVQAEAQIGAIMESLGTRSSYQPKASLVADMVEKREIAHT